MHAGTMPSREMQAKISSLGWRFIIEVKMSFSTKNILAKPRKNIDNKILSPMVAERSILVQVSASPNNNHGRMATLRGILC